MDSALPNPILSQILGAFKSGKKTTATALIFLYSRGFGRETVYFASFVMVTASNRQMVIETSLATFLSTKMESCFREQVTIF